MRYAIVIEKAEGNYSAYVPEGMIAEGLAVPALGAMAEYVEAWAGLSFRE